MNEPECKEADEWGQVRSLICELREQNSDLQRKLGQVNDQLEREIARTAEVRNELISLIESGPVPTTERSVASIASYVQRY